MTRAMDGDELWEGQMLGLVVRGVPVLLVRREGRVFAYRDRCAHLGVALSKGTLEGCVLTCHAHRWQYDVTTGRGVNPARATLERIAVREEPDGIFVSVEEAGGG